MKITCIILTYNESARIQNALTHAIKWADEVVVIDKSSTDDTREIAARMGARVEQIPFSRQGHEDQKQLAAFAGNDWIWGFTPGEVPTAALITEGRRIAETGEWDLVRIPMKYFSFGIHHEKSPWSWSLQSRLYDRRKIVFSPACHTPATADRITAIQPTEQIYCLHQTHATADSFIRAHADYAINEAAQGTPQEAIKRGSFFLNYYNAVFSSDTALASQGLGWQIYWLSVILHAWERTAENVPAQYRARAQELLAAEWPE